MQKANKSDKCFFTALHTCYFIFMLEIDNKPAHTWLENQSQKNGLVKKGKHRRFLFHRSSDHLLSIYLFLGFHMTTRHLDVQIRVQL